MRGLFVVVTRLYDSLHGRGDGRSLALSSGPCRGITVCRRLLIVREHVRVALSGVLQVVSQRGRADVNGKKARQLLTKGRVGLSVVDGQGRRTV